jgi:voltage-gated potassium channel
MILGYGIIAVPTGIVSAELVRPSWRRALACAGCGTTDHQEDAAFCRRCGGALAR